MTCDRAQRVSIHPNGVGSLNGYMHELHRGGSYYSGAGDVYTGYMIHVINRFLYNLIGTRRILRRAP